MRRKKVPARTCHANVLQFGIGGDECPILRLRDTLDE
jgi:hypothetical protein